jgi:ribosomal protein S18 acetylase RimI-like enzyme
MAQEKRDQNISNGAAKRSFSVRTMEIEDLADVYQLGAMNFKADLWPMLYRSWDEYEVTTLFNTDGDYCLVAENDDWEPGSKEQRIVGFVLGTVISKPGSAWSYGYVLWLCSHDLWAREGVAGKLVDKLVEIMVEEDGIRIIMADTDPDNHRAVRFFSKKGFTDTKPHLYLSSNLEHNPHYAPLLKKTRAAAAAETAERKKKKKKPKDWSRRWTSGSNDEKKKRTKSKKKLKKRKKKKKKTG